jgi:hypothetical protein
MALGAGWNPAENAAQQEALSSLITFTTHERFS